MGLAVLGNRQFALGTRDQVPRPCGCTALVRDPKLAADVPGEAERLDDQRRGR